MGQAINTKTTRGYYVLIGLMAIGLITLNLLLVYLLYVLLPDDGQQTVHLFGTRVKPTPDGRIIALVMIAGALGSYVHAATSFVSYVGARKFYPNWVWWYLLRPFIGIALAMVFYFAVRGGLLSAQGSHADNLNTYGVLTISGLAGMFSKQAVDKLNELFNNLFKTDKQAKLADSMHNDNQNANNQTTGSE